VRDLSDPNPFFLSDLCALRGGKANSSDRRPGGAPGARRPA
jgi:hypothetical protein